MSAPPSPASAATLSKPARLLVAIALTALGFGAVVAGTAAIGGGRDFHAMRIAAVFIFMLPVAIALIWREQTPLVRVAGALAALLLGAAAWWQFPCRIGGMNLLRATAERDQLRSSMELVTFEEVRLGRHFQKRIDDLAGEYPTVAATLRSEFTRWGVDAEAAIVEKLRDTPANDIAGARTARARGRDLSQLFPGDSDGIEALFQSWAKSALQARIDELNDLRLADWKAFDTTAASRRQLAQAFPDKRERLITAEKAWVLRSASAVTEPALQSLDTKPRQVSVDCTNLERRVRALKGVQGKAEQFHEARLALFFLAHEAACREVLLHIRAEQYLTAFTTANRHRIDWIKVPGLLGPNEKKLMSALTEQARHLSIRFDKAGFVETAPQPRSRETAPLPRTKVMSTRQGMFVAVLIMLSAGAESAQPPIPLDAATERKLLDEALGHVRDKKYAFAVARLAPLAKSQMLPAPVVKAIPGLIGDLRSLEALRQLAVDAPDGKPPAVAFDGLPASVKRQQAWLELLRAVEALIETPLPPGALLPWSVEQANKLLESVAAEFGNEMASRLRVELSARLFLVGRPTDATKLIENETPNEYAREVLADLRTIVLGGGALVNPQVAHFVPEKGLNEMPGVAALIPPTLRDKWQRPKPPAAGETTLTQLQKRAAAAIAKAAKPEAETLAKKVDATVAAIRAELAKP